METIFIDMFAPKWARGPHNLARFPSWDPCITPGYWAWYLNALSTSGSLIRWLFYAFMPREGIYTCVFCPPSSPQRRKPGYAALLRIRGNYFRPYLSIPRVCHRGAAYRRKFSYALYRKTESKTFWNKLNKADIDKTRLPAVTKFAYLKELVDPRLRQGIDGLPFTSEGYERAKNILQTNYGQTSEIINARWGGKELFSQLAKRSPSVVVRVDFLDFIEARSEPTEEIRNA